MTYEWTTNSSAAGPSLAAMLGAAGTRHAGKDLDAVKARGA